MKFAKPLLLFALLVSFYGGSSAIILPSPCTVKTLFPLFPSLTPGTLVNVDGMQGVLVLGSQLTGRSTFLGTIICPGSSGLPQSRFISSVLEYELAEGENPALQLALVRPVGSFPKKLVASLPPSETPVPSTLSFGGNAISAVTGGICAAATAGRGVCVEPLPNGPPISGTTTSLPIFDPVSGFLFGIGSGKTIGQLTASSSGNVGVLEIDENTIVFVQPPAQLT